MPKHRFFYKDAIMKLRTDARAQTIQMGIDEMSHSLQLGIILRQMGRDPSFKSDDVIRYPRVLDDLKRDNLTDISAVSCSSANTWICRSGYSRMPTASKDCPEP